MKTKAYANKAADKPFEPYSFDRRSIGPKDVGINIKFCGICHSDIHTARGEWGPAKYPCVPGHEIVGTVTSVGNEVKKFKRGDVVGVGCLVGSCGKCQSCKEDLEQYCENGWIGTYNSTTPEEDYTKGGYSDYIVVNEHFVLSIPNNLELSKVAPLLCAGITTYSPLRHLNVGKNDKVAILGLGGLGHMGVKLAASFGADVTVFSKSPQKKDDAKQLGAHDFVLTTNEHEIAKRTNHFDVILDTVSAPHDLEQALGMIKREGALVMVGASADPLKLPVFPLIFNRRKIMGSLIGGLKETQEMLVHCSKNNIVSDIEIIKPSAINEAYQRVLKSDVKYRFVIDCSSF